MSSRAERVAARLEERELDLVLVTDLANVRYLTGFTGSNAIAVVGADVRRFVTDSRYVEQAALEVSGFDCEQAPPEFLDALSAGWPVGGRLQLGFDDANVSVKTHGRLRSVIPDRIELAAAGGLVEAERAVKDAGEVARIRAAAALCDEIYEWVLAAGVVGRAERDVAIALEHEMRLRGASDPSFRSIVASGERGALPHAAPGDQVISSGTLVTLDLGVRLDGYCSDCTRTWATGGGLPDALAEAYELVSRAQAAALDAVRAGPSGREIDAVARGIIEEAGHGEHFGHGLGHGVGLEVHEAPRLSRTAKDALAAGNVVTVEPGVYLPGVGGVRIEDLVLVTDDGREILTGTTKDLITVD